MPASANGFIRGVAVNKITSLPDVGLQTMYTFTQITNGDYQPVVRSDITVNSLTQTVSLLSTPLETDITFTLLSSGTQINQAVTRNSEETMLANITSGLAGVSLPLRLSCIKAGDLTLTYQLFEYGTTTVPSWVTVDDLNSALI